MLKYHIDSPQKHFLQYHRGQIHIAGWCFDKATKQPIDRVFIRLGQREIECQKVTRKDVASTFAAKQSELGFCASFNTGNGLKLIRVFAEYQGMETPLGKYLVYCQKQGTSTPSSKNEEYQRWIQLHDTLDTPQIKQIKQELAEFQSQPLISIIVPVYNTPANYLRQAIDSVINQIYINWELCLADDASTNPEIKKVLEEYSQKEKRIRVKYRKQNGHISNTSNDALEMSRGAWIALLDHDDMLRPHALYHAVKVINTKKDVQLIYSDEDKIDENNLRCHPYFKPDYNQDLLLSHNCITHLSVIRRSLMNKVDGFRVGYEGAQDWDLLLRCIEKIENTSIYHIPHILYHWRMHAGSTALSSDTKSYASVAAQKAISEHLTRCAQPAKVIDGFWQGSFRVQYHIQEPTKASIIIPTKDQFELLSQCIESLIHKTDYTDYEIIVVDNQTTEEKALAYLNKINAMGNISVIKWDESFNYSKINNFAAKQATGEVLVFLNNDTEIINETWLEELVSQALRPEIGAVGAKLYFPNETIQHAGIILDIGPDSWAGHCFIGFPKGHHGDNGRASLIQNYCAVTAACMATRRQLFLESGGFDEKLKVACNDVDYCLRLHSSGYRNLWTPYSELLHYESMSRGYEVKPERAKAFKAEVASVRSKYPALFANDPCYNPNLDRNTPHFNLKFSTEST